jgi:hypothetical protein
MTHNMNQLIDKGGLDLTLDETTWLNSSYADIQGRLQGKKTNKSGQHVLLLDFTSQTQIWLILNKMTKLKKWT